MKRLREARGVSVEMTTTYGQKIFRTVLHIDDRGTWVLDGEDQLVAAMGRERYNEWLIDLWTQPIPEAAPVNFVSGRDTD